MDHVFICHVYVGQHCNCEHVIRPQLLEKPRPGQVIKHASKVKQETLINFLKCGRNY